MRKIFCRDVGNAQSFLQGVQALKQRGAVESSWMLVEATPGLGKSSTLEWYSAQYDVPMVRAKAAWTESWALRDIVLALGLEPQRTRQGNLDLIIGEAMGHELQIIVDEINLAAAVTKILESLRDISDMAQAQIIVAGHKGVSLTLKRHKQIYSRITSFVEFSAASAEDVKAIYKSSSDIPVSDCAIAEITRQTGGLHREVMNTIVRIETLARRHKGQTITAEIIGNTRLTNDGQIRGQ